MSDLSGSERRKLEKLLGMGSGYVLNRAGMNWLNSSLLTTTFAALFGVFNARRCWPRRQLSYWAESAPSMSDVGKRTVLGGSLAASNTGNGLVDGSRKS